MSEREHDALVRIANAESGVWGQIAREALDVDRAEAEISLSFLADSIRGALAIQGWQANDAAILRAARSVRRELGASITALDL